MGRQAGRQDGSVRVERHWHWHWHGASGYPEGEGRKGILHSMQVMSEGGDAALSPSADVLACVLASGWSGEGRTVCRPRGHGGTHGRGRGREGMDVMMG